MSEATAEDCLRAAFQATLRGDYAERDRLCERGRLLLDAERAAGAVERVLAVDYYVRRDGTCVPTKAMAKAAGVIH